MDKLSNREMIKYAKEITIAKVENSDILPSGINGNDVADFMESIYNKIVELNKNGN